MANALTTTQPKEYRAFEIFNQIPTGCHLFPVLDQGSDPHLRYGEVAVIDTSDTKPTHGEVFVIQWNSGRRQIVQLMSKALKGLDGDYVGWFTSELEGRVHIPGVGMRRMVDGPRTEEMIRPCLVGRVVGVIDSLPVQGGSI